MVKTNSNETTIKDNTEISRKIIRFYNLNENEITITESKLENILLKHSKALKEGRDWKTPLGLMTTILILFPTTEFNKDFLNIKPFVWEAFFLLLLVISIIWLFKSLWSLWLHRKENLGSLIGKIKNEGDRKNTQPYDSGEKTLKIIKAMYGIPGKDINITGKLNGLIRHDELTTWATNALVTKDPAPGIVKSLNIEYEIGGVKFTKDFNENDLVTLP